MSNQEDILSSSTSCHQLMISNILHLRNLQSIKMPVVSMWHCVSVLVYIHIRQHFILPLIPYKSIISKKIKITTWRWDFIILFIRYRIQVGTPCTWFCRYFVRITYWLSKTLQLRLLQILDSWLQQTTKQLVEVTNFRSLFGDSHFS